MDKLNQWLTLAANIGVIAGIVFLGLELQQNNRLLNSQALYDMMQNRQSYWYAQLQVPGLADKLARAMDGATLTTEEETEIEVLIRVAMISWEFEYKQFENGSLSKDDLPLAAWKQNLQSPVYRDVWNNSTNRFSPTFVKFVEQELIPKKPGVFNG